MCREMGRMPFETSPTEIFVACRADLIECCLSSCSLCLFDTVSYSVIKFASKESNSLFVKIRSGLFMFSTILLMSRRRREVCLFLSLLTLVVNGELISSLTPPVSFLEFWIRLCGEEASWSLVRRDLEMSYSAAYSTTVWAEIFLF